MPLESHQDYLRTRLPAYTGLHRLFGELQEISHVVDPLQRAQMVHTLVEKHRPSDRVL